VPSEFGRMSATVLARLVAEKKISPVELTQDALLQAERSQASLNAFYVLLPDEALAAAKRAEDAVMRNEPLGAIHGLPFSAKDLMAVGGAPYASGSLTMKDNVAAADAPAVERAKAAGGILIGKTTTSEFGCKAVGDSPLTGVTRNPLDLSKTPGGSSAGAAASVRAGITPFALGTDGGGSLRIPASLTGLVGFKGQAGRVPVWPTSATPTLAHVGPLARSVEDAALLFSVIAGFDRRDPRSVAGPVPDVLKACRIGKQRSLRVAYSPTLGYARPERDVVAVVDHAVKRLETHGYSVELVEKVFEEDPIGLWAAEFYAGVGTRLRPFLESQRHLLDPAVADVLDLALARDMRAYYQSMFQRYAFIEETRLFFERYDLLVTPTLPISSLEAGKNVPDTLANRNLLSWVFYTYPFNLTGQPALSICAGHGSDGMPVGLQIVGRSHCEEEVIAAAAAFERLSSGPFSQSGT
jgi:aspartyl-tRNA(Asn)/glutamyl-tRNA(Gln) amidotransferase subunit A